MTSQDEMIRENAGDALNQAVQSPEGAKTLPAPDSNTGGVPDPETSANGHTGSNSPADVQAGIEEAEKAKAAFQDATLTASTPGTGAEDSMSKDPAVAAQGSATIEDDLALQNGQSGGGQSTAGQSAAIDTDAPARAREQAEEEGDSDENKEPGTGEMLSSILASDPALKWESKIVSAFSSDSDDDK